MTFMKCSGFLWRRSVWIWCASIRHLSSAASVPAFSMADSAVLVLRFRSLTYVSNAEIRSVLSIGASRFFGIGELRFRSKLDPTLHRARMRVYECLGLRVGEFLLVSSSLEARPAVLLAAPRVTRKT